MSNIRWEVSHWRSMTVVCFILSLIPSSSEASNINLGTGVGSILACCVQDTANLKATAHLLLNGTYSPKWDINMEAYRHNENVKTGLQALIVEEKQSGTWAVSQEQSLEGCSHHVPVCQVSASEYNLRHNTGYIKYYLHFPDIPHWRKCIKSPQWKSKQGLCCTGSNVTGQVCCAFSPV